MSKTSSMGKSTRRDVGVVIGVVGDVQAAGTRAMSMSCLVCSGTVCEGEVSVVRGDEEWGTHRGVQIEETHR